MNKVKYKKRRKYKFNLHEDVTCETGLAVEKPNNLKFISIDGEGVLYIRHGYAWDGASYTINSKSIIRASLVHDALYQLMREGILPQAHRLEVDVLFRKMCVEDGMSPALARIKYWVVRKLGARFARSDLLVAP